MKIIKDIPLLKTGGASPRYIAFGKNHFYLSNGEESRVYMCDSAGHFICSYHAKHMISSFCFDSENGYFIASSPQHLNRLFIYDASFCKLDVKYLPTDFCNDQPISCVKFDPLKKLTVLKKGERWISAEFSKDVHGLCCKFNSSSDSISNLSAVCCQAVVFEKIDILSDNDGDGYYDLTVPAGYVPLDLCIVHIGSEDIKPAAVVQLPDGSRHLVTFSIFKEKEHFNSHMSDNDAQKIGRQFNIKMTLAQLVFTLCDITVSLPQDGEEYLHSHRTAEISDRAKIPYLNRLKSLLYLDD